MHKLHILITLSASLAAPAVFSFEPHKILPSRQPQRDCSRRGILEGFKKSFCAAAAGIVVATVPSQSVSAARPIEEARKLFVKPTGPIAEATKLFVPPTRFINEYDDMLHPGCDRRIELDPTPSKINGDKVFSVTFSGEDVGPDGIGSLVKLACTDETIEKYKLRSWTFDGRVDATGSDIDAGDGIHVGRWHQSTKDQPWAGIKWNDGNRWTVKETE
mmetsp:Transcript_46651/g.56074  ORF Transcript_46651/g.56074 Transcript_46651/m.56074 type:complete len:217 (-) Transcript_46651:92-742(-)